MPEAKAGGAFASPKPRQSYFCSDRTGSTTSNPISNAFAVFGRLVLLRCGSSVRPGLESLAAKMCPTSGKVSPMIHVIATIQTAAGRRDDLLAAFRELVPQVRAEAGCIEYGPAVDLDTPISSQAARSDVVTVVEKWESEASLKDHLAAPHMKTFRERVKDFLAGVEIRVIEPR
jgi:quinol monooxygenase YgiN